MNLYKIGLLSGAATVALLAAGSAQAQMYSTGPGVYLSLEGRYLWNRSSKTADIDPATATPLIAPFVGTDAKTDKGWGGKAMLGYRFGNDWDVGFGFSGGWLTGPKGAKHSSGSGTGMSTYNGRLPHTFTSVDEKIKVKLNYQVADFEAGYNWKMGAASNLRLFGGVRFAHFKQQANASIDAATSQTAGGPLIGSSVAHGRAKRTTTFSGVGPRIGVNGQLGLGAGGLNLFGGASGALLIGRYKDRHSISVATPMNTTSTSFTDKRKTKLVPNAEGEIGLGYNFTAGGNSTLGIQIGYRAEGWWGVSSDAPVFGSSASHATNQFMHGPFVRLLASFGAAAPPAMAAPPPTGQPAMSKKSFIVFFDFDKSNITTEAQKTINDAAATAKSGNAAQVTLTGHTDRSGSEQYNLALSLRRAEAVKAAMIKQGVPASLIVVVGKGESQPLVPTADGVREPQNRRVEIVI